RSVPLRVRREVHDQEAEAIPWLRRVAASRRKDVRVRNCKEDLPSQARRLSAVLPVLGRQRGSGDVDSAKEFAKGARGEPGRLRAPVLDAAWCRVLSIRRQNGREIVLGATLADVGVAEVHVRLSNEDLRTAGLNEGGHRKSEIPMWRRLRLS